MIRLAIAVGFLAVFGFVAWAAILLLKNYFASKENKNVEPTNTKNETN